MGLSNFLMSQQSLQQKVQAFADMQILKNASISIHVLDLDKQHTLAEFDKSRSLCPASSIKAITTAIALDKLGEDFKYQSSLAYSGNIQNGTLQGDLVLIGSGDPSLGSDQMTDALNYDDFFKTCIQEIKSEGIQNITGNIIIDASYFDRDASPGNYAYMDLGNYYASGVWAMNIHENLYHLYFKQSPAKDGRAKVINTFPAIENLSFVNELKNGSANSGDNAYIYGAPYTFKKHLRGSLPLGTGEFKIKGSIPNPPLHVAQKLLAELNEANISVNGEAKVQYEKYSQTLNNIHQFFSPSLLEICRRTNKKSVNVYAEALIKTLGKKFKGEGSYEKGTAFIKEYFSEIGIDTKGFYLKDGSGLSLNNGLSAEHFTRLLYHIFCNKNLFPLYKNTLVEMEPGIYTKSGSMERVRSYTGYTVNKSGGTIAYSIIVNNYEGKSSPLIKAMKDLIMSLKI